MKKKLIWVAAALLAVTVVVLVVARFRSQPLPSTYRGVTLPTPQPSGDIPLPPPVWLIVGDQAIPASLAAGGTVRGHFDPAFAIPDIATATLPAEASAVIVVASESFTEFKATVRAWREDGSIVPLLDDTARELNAEIQQQGNLTVFTLEPTGEAGDQLLNVYITFSTENAWGFYLWRLNPAPVLTPTATIVISEALRQDAEALATQLGISVDEAIRRLNAQDSIGALNAKLEQQEAETFAGLWIQHEPEYRVIVAFTRNGRETIKPYIENTSLAGLVEVRTAKVSLTELRTTQQTVSQIVQELGFLFSSGINVQKNQVELYVTDQALFEASLHKASLQLPEPVEIIVTYEPLGNNIPFAVTPVPDLFLPQLRARSSTFMTALLQGKLVAKEGCLRVSSSNEDSGILIIWQSDYFLNQNKDSIEVLNREGQVVARVNEEISIGGGEVPLTAELELQLREPIPSQCKGPYWLMGEIVTEK